MKGESIEDLGHPVTPLPPISLEITMRSGTTISVDVDTFEFTKTLGGDRALKWTSPDGAKRILVHVLVEEIVAIVEVSS